RPAARHYRGLDRDLLHHGNLSDLSHSLRQRTTPPQERFPPLPGALFLLPRFRVWFAARPPAYLVPPDPSDLCQRPRVVGPTTRPTSAASAPASVSMKSSPIGKNSSKAFASNIATRATGSRCMTSSPRCCASKSSSIARPPSAFAAGVPARGNGSSVGIP